MQKANFPNRKNSRSSATRLVAPAIALLGLCAALPQAGAVTANGTVSAGDVFILANNLNGFSQIEDGTRAGGAVTYGGGAVGELGGIFADANGIYFAGNPAGGPTVEWISLGQTTSVPLLAAADFIGAGGTALRDIAVLNSGAIFTLYTNGAVDQFTPNGLGGYTRSAIGSFTGFTSDDRGSGHQLSISLNGQYLLTSSRTQNRIWSLNVSSGAVQQWSPPAGLLGPVSGTQLTLSATSVLDTARGDRLLAPMSNDGLYEVAFDPLTGSFPAAAPFRLSNDTVATFIDGVGFDGDGDLNISMRNDGTVGSLREFSQAELVAAAAGASFTVYSKTAYYTATDARVARDLVVVVPEPSAAALLLVAAGGCFAQRRRRRR